MLIINLFTYTAINFRLHKSMDAIAAIDFSLHKSMGAIEAIDL